MTMRNWLLKQVRLLVATYFILAVLVPGCDSQPKSSASAVPEAQPKQPASSQQTTKPAFDWNRTQLLAASIVAESPGTQWGRVEMQRNGLLLQPGSSPTTVEFNIGGKFPSGRLNAWMVQLPADAASNPKAGTANVTILCDGIQVAKAKIDRSNNLVSPVNLTGVSMLKITVDDAGDGPFWDGVHVGVQ